MSSTHQLQSDILYLSHPEYAAQLFETSVFSDCTIRSRHQIWHLHRCILTPRCEFFWKCFQGEFEEANSCTVQMHDDDPSTLERMLKWIYTLKYPEPQKGNGTATAWTGDLMLYMMAEKYGLTGLMEATRQALLNRSTECNDHAEEFVSSAEDFVNAMHMLYEELPDREDILTLRQDLLSTMAPLIAKCMRSLPVLQELMMTLPDFSLSFVELLAQKQTDQIRSSTSTPTLSIGSGSSNPGSGSNSPRYVKPYIPLNEDSEDELD